MRFSSLAATAAILTSAVNAVPLLTKRDGPSGAVVTPVGDAEFTVGDILQFKYKRAQTSEATTQFVNLTMLTRDGKVNFLPDDIAAGLQGVEAHQSTC